MEEMVGEGLPEPVEAQANNGNEIPSKLHACANNVPRQPHYEQRRQSDRMLSRAFPTVSSPDQP
jgi:hypothetical protein